MKYDAAILGSGPGGYICAIRCAQYGLKTLLVEERELGGTCLNRGCIPTKTLLHSAQLFRQTRNLAKFGVHAENPTFDFSEIAARRDKIVSQLRGGVANVLKARGVTVVSGRGSLAAPNVLSVAGETYEAARVVLATGTRPNLPPIEGIGGSNILTTDDVLKLSELPESAVIIGGGVTGIEFASILASFGVKVTVLKRSPRVLPGADDEIVRLLLRKLKQLRITFKAGVSFTRITGESEKTVEYVDQTTQTAASASGAVCIICTGRAPNSDAIGLESAGVKTERGFVPVNGELLTNVPNVYAIGDLNGMRALAHAASAQAKAAAAHCAGLSRPYSDKAVPNCVYTDPEVAWVGLSESDAQKAGYNVRVGRFHIPGNGKALIMGVDTGLVKIVADETGEILGAHLIAPRASDMIAEFAALIEQSASVSDLADVIHPHPTLSEVIGEAADDVLGLCCHSIEK